MKFTDTMRDYIVAKGIDPIALEHEMLENLDQRGAEYPAEHSPASESRHSQIGETFF